MTNPFMPQQSTNQLSGLQEILMRVGLEKKKQQDILDRMTVLKKQEVEGTQGGGLQPETDPSLMPQGQQAAQGQQGGGQNDIMSLLGGLLAPQLIKMLQGGGGLGALGALQDMQGGGFMNMLGGGGASALTGGADRAMAARGAFNSVV